MKSVIALLLGISCTFAAITAPEPELDWSDSQDQDGEEDEAYNGLIVQVYNKDDGVSVALGSDYDDFDLVYCLNLLALFESEDYNVTTGDFSILSDTYQNFSNCSVTETSTTNFDVVCYLDGSATLSLAFTFTTDSQGDNGLEYIITLSDYGLANNETKLIIVQSLEVCSDEYSLDSSDDQSDADESNGDEDSDDDDEDDTDNADEVEEDGDDDDDDDDTDDDDRRRLIRGESGDDHDHDDSEDDDDDDSEDDESSSDEEGEIDVGFSRFVSNGQAVDKCGDEVSNVDSAVVQQSSLNQIHLVFNYFECELVLDPFYGLDDSKYAEAFPQNLNEESKANSIQFTIALIVSFIAMII